uniref:PD-(D/E)XK nuclease family transposase n=1 Tax=Candidatus Kentrum sp. FM TaxID=2126340 RepID=A0A450WDS9_9GAMM|nr:MAG: conserved hypothetical protein (putative transposase or invertase) [Candidatus Kentron sp. FM]
MKAGFPSEPGKVTLWVHTRKHRNMSKYLNPYTDFGFKKLFGEEANKDLLIDFLNQLLPPHHRIAALDFRNTERLPDIPLDRRAIFDIHCLSTTGERFIVEMQKAKIQLTFRSFREAVSQFYIG